MCTVDLTSDLGAGLGRWTLDDDRAVAAGRLNPIVHRDGRTAAHAETGVHLQAFAG